MKINIIGGGIGGLATAIALQKQGHQVTVYENAPAFKPLGAGLVMAANAMKALQVIGIAEAVAQVGKPLAKGAILDARGKVISRVDVTTITQRFGMHNFTIHRAALHEILLGCLRPGTVVNGKNCVGVAQDQTGVTVHFADGSSDVADCLLACDGIRSVVRQQLVPDSRIRYAGHACWRAVTEVQPDKVDMENFTESWDTAGRFGIAPLAGNQVYWYACLNVPQDSPEAKAFMIPDLYERFKQFHDPVPYLLQNTPNEKLLLNDIIDFKPLRRLAFGKILLMGDAGHATTPNMGQGACQAIEDAAVLLKLLGTHAHVEEDFKAFEQKRLKRTEKINTLSWQIGKLAHVKNPFLAQVRNTVMRLLPDSVNNRQVAFLYDVAF
ncbi:MAG: FAD-dependent monooxygenase [Cytophagales bacterium]|nr:FAD-dependent monooxygenase [Cytophagales bacterium]